MEAKFIEIPSFDVADSGNWIVEPDEQLVYQSALYPDLIVVPGGFKTDFASIPRIFTPIHPKDGKHRLAAVVHDYLCRLEGFPRKLADKIFYEAMIVLGVRKTRRMAFYIAVRIGAIFSRKRKPL
jgi:hypothetical protein